MEAQVDAQKRDKTEPATAVPHVPVDNAPHQDEATRSASSDKAAPARKMKQSTKMGQLSKRTKAVIGEADRESERESRGPRVTEESSTNEPSSTGSRREAQTAEQPLGERNATDGATPEGAAVATVVAEGVGTSADEALKDAFRNAVRQVVGAVVDAETLVKNEDVVKDQVLTYSDGFVPEHTQLSASHENGIYRVSIRAKVQRRSVIRKLQAANVTTREIAGQSIFGSVVTQLQAENNAAAIVRRAFDGLPGKPGFPLAYLTAEVVGEPVARDRNQSNATLAIRVRARIDVHSFDAFAKRLRATLEPLARQEGEFSLTSRRLNSQEGNGAYARNSAERRVNRNRGMRTHPLTAGKGADGHQQFAVKRATYGLDSIHKQALGTTFGNRTTRARGRSDEPSNDTPIALAVNTSRDASFEKTEWKYYVLDRSVLPVLAACACTIYELKLTLSGREGGEIAVVRALLYVHDDLGWTAIAPLAFDCRQEPIA